MQSTFIFQTKLKKSSGMTPVVEDKVLSMKEKLLKISRQKNAGHKNVMTNFFSNGILDLSLVRPNNKEVTVRLASLSDQGTLGIVTQNILHLTCDP